MYIKAPITSDALYTKNLEYPSVQKEPNPKMTTTGTTAAIKSWAIECKTQQHQFLYDHRPVK